MNPPEFVAKWGGSTRSERAASQEHFIDICNMLGVKTPTRTRPARPTPSRTNFTGTAKQVHEFTLADMAKDPTEPLRVLRAVMTSPEDLRPDLTREQLTEEAAGHFAAIATSLRGKGHDPDKVAHFLTKLLFCLYAEDSGLLPSGLMERLTLTAVRDPDGFADALADLFGKMSQKGGLFGTDRIEWFNGGLFDGPDVLPMDVMEIAVLGLVSAVDWSQVEPAIFGTLFERGLDPGKRSQLGAHYTDKISIGVLVEAVVLTPLRREFDAMKARVESLLEAGHKPRLAPVRGKKRVKNDPVGPWEEFLNRVRSGASPRPRSPFRHLPGRPRL